MFVSEQSFGAQTRAIDDQPFGQTEKRVQAAERNPATAHMFIINPLHARSVDSLFSTHPDTASRVSRLRQQAVEMGQAPRPWG